MKKLYRSKTSESGFTLIELGILMTVFSLLLATALSEYSRFKQQKIISDTKSRERLVTQSLSTFVANFNRLPCPADPSLPPTNIMAGMEKCLSTPPWNIPKATIPANDGEVRRVAGFRDTTADLDALPDPVLIGSVPYVTLGITHQETMDGWGSAFTYAVSEFITDPASYDDKKGVIRKLFRSTVVPIGAIFPELADIDPPNPAIPNAFIIALISHGRDKRGGYNYQGNLIAPCDMVALDSRNCDLDAEFLSADPKTDIYNLDPGALYFDDAFTVFGITRDGDKWAYTSGTTIENKTGGNVGIGTNSPLFPMHVDGNILVSDDYKTNSYCNETGGNCFPSAMIGGVGVACGFNGLVTGIANSDVICATKINPTSLVTGPCPLGEFIRGITAGGAIICAP